MTTMATTEQIEAARDALDHIEHFIGHPGFIQEIGGQDAFDAEYAKRARIFITLDSRSSSPEDIRQALADLATIN